MNEIFFSIILPTFNREKKIIKAINSVLNQTYENWELIIIDNYSDDNTEKIIRRINNNKIHYFKYSNNGNIAKSRNFGIKKSKGNFLCFLDSDDWWNSKKLYYAQKFLKKGYKFLYHDMIIRRKNIIFDIKLSYCRQLKSLQFEDLKKNGPAFATSSVVVEKDLFSECNFFDENNLYIAWEDYDAWLRISKNYDNFYKIDKTLGYVFIDNENYLDAKKSILNLNEFLKKYILNDKIPNWVNYNLIKSNFLLKNFFYVKENLFKIKFSKLTIKQKLYYIYMFIKIFI